MQHICILTYGGQNGRFWAGRGLVFPRRGSLGGRVSGAGSDLRACLDLRSRMETRTSNFFLLHRGQVYSASNPSGLASRPVRTSKRPQSGQFMIPFLSPLSHL